MQAHDFVKYADLVAAGIASQTPVMQKAIAEYKAAVAAWDERNNLATEKAAMLAAKAEMDNANVLFSRERDAFAQKVAEFNAKVDKAAAEDKARKDTLTAQAKKVEDAILAYEKKEQAAVAAAAVRNTNLQKREAELDELNASLTAREQAVLALEAKMKAAQVTLGKALG